MKQFADLPENEIMALTIYGEARGEPYLGKVAVGSVILNRVDHRDWDGKTIKEVCLKHKQFSCFNEKDDNYPILSNIAQNPTLEASRNRVFKICLDIATDMIAGKIERITEGLDYHAVGTTPYWQPTKKRVDKIGRHIFYV